MGVSIIGMGHVGLCMAVCLADRGFRVIGVDKDGSKIELVNKGEAPFYEPGLSDLLKEVLEEGEISFTTDHEIAVKESDISFIAVGTPSKPDGSTELKYVRSAASDIASALKEKPEYHLVVVRSTVIPGTSENVVKPIIEDNSGKKCGVGFGLCMNPEFLREGSAIHDIFYPDRIIIGEYDRRSGDLLEDMYRTFHVEGMPPLLRTNLPTAEMIKYANNAFLAMKVSFINTMSNLCERIPSVDVTTIAKGIGFDERIGPLFLRAGLGYGGSCLPKDLDALIAFSERLGYSPELIKATVEVNDDQPHRAIELAKKLIGSLKNKRVAVLGLAFKPGTDDMREAVSIKVIEGLLKEGAEVISYDPRAIKNARRIFGDRIAYSSSPLECIEDADCCIIVTEWNEFKSIKPEDFVERMRTPAVVDGRRIYDPAEFSRKLKFAAVGLGRSIKMSRTT